MGSPRRVMAQGVAMRMKLETVRKDKRRFIRHSVTMAVQCRKEGHMESCIREMRDISFGGMSFVSSDAYAPGDVVEMEFPVATVRNRVTGEIIWSSALMVNPVILFANGLRFLNMKMLFIARLIEQMCCIEKYRDAQISRQHRTLSRDEAAAEWIRLCAARFPGG